jgi:gamma-glutamyltranspeptidase / glutathione hydrolase
VAEPWRRQVGASEARRGYGGAVASGHYLATDAGIAILREGGNAFDAAACVAFCLNVLEPFLVGTGGEVPILVRPAGRGVVAISGQGGAPAALTLDRLESMGVERIPGDGFLPAVVPGALGGWLAMLDRYGSMPLERIVEPAAELADGFPMYRMLAEQLGRYEDRLGQLYPTTADVCLAGGVPTEGARFSNPALAAFYRRIGATGSPVAAARLFYEGELGRQLLTEASGLATQDSSGETWPCLLTADDLAAWKPTFEKPVSRTYRGHRVFKCDTWCQGPVFLQQLAILQRFDPWSAAPDAASLHRYIEAHKLAFADREAWYGDPAHADVPLQALLSDAYARTREVSDRASMAAQPGQPDGRVPPLLPWFPGAGGEGAGESMSGAAAGPHAGWGPKDGDTTHVDVVDRHGNLVSATPSGAWAQSSPMLPGLGFCLGTRGQMFHVRRGHPNAPAPGKRPRTTLTPSLAELKDGRWLVFGTPGGDCQDQWTLLLFLALADAGLDPQAACDAPLLKVAHLPNSFHPREARPGSVELEEGWPEEIVQGLRERGHGVTVGPATQGRCSVIEVRTDGTLTAAISRRQGHPSVGVF